MEPEVKYTVVGAAVIIALSGLVFFILWMTGGMGGEETKRFMIYFKEHSLSGLQKDSPVTMKGIRVGSVSDFRISSEDIQKVKVLIEVDESTPVRMDTEAVVSRNLLTGIANIELAHSTQESPLLEDAEGGEEYPVIREGKSDFQAVAESLPETMRKIRDALNRIGDLFSDENQENITGILINLNKLSAAFGDNSPHIDELLKDLPQFIRSLSSESGSLKADISEAARAVRVAADNISRQTTRLGDQYYQTARTINEASEKFKDPAAIIRGPKKDELGPGETAP